MVAFVRAAAFAATAPLAGSGVVPKIVRGALALVLTPAIAATAACPRFAGGADLWPACIENAVVGLAFGVTASAVAAAATAAGGLADAAIASQAVGREAVFGGESGPIARLYALGFALAFFATGSMTHLCARFVEASSGLVVAPTVLGAAALARFSLESSLGIAAPSIAAQLLATSIAAFVARAAPRINGMMLASPASAAIVLLALFAASAETLVRMGALARAASSFSVP
jgi:flagellar biosynthesis protein FliR